MYSMDHLVTLITLEKARELRFCVGRSPIVVLETGERSLQGPPTSGEEVERLFRSVADSRQMRELRKRGAMQFVYTLPNRMPVLVRAKMDGANVAFDIS